MGTPETPTIRPLLLVPWVARLEGVHCNQATLAGTMGGQIRGGSL